MKEKMQSIPTKIQNEINDNPKLDWIDKYDRLYNNELLEDYLKLENQLSFWRSNCSIRLALKEIEQIIIQSSHKPSRRLVGWSEIARRAKCDRNTLKRSDRLKWIVERREKLSILIEEKQEDNTKTSLVVLSTDEEKILKLRKELELSKKEAAKWFVKYEEQSTELSLMTDAINRQLESNSLLNEEINMLRRRIKEQISNNSTKN